MVSKPIKLYIIIIRNIMFNKNAHQTPSYKLITERVIFNIKMWSVIKKKNMIIFNYNFMGTYRL